MKARYWIWRALQISTVITAAGTGVALFEKPFAEPYVLRAKAEAELALDQAIRKQMTSAWAAAELDRAVERKDLDRVMLLSELIEHHRIPVAQSHTTRAREFVKRETGTVIQVQQCFVCLWDAAECRTPAEFLFCNVPIKLTPVEDVRSLVEAGSDAAMGKPVDRIDVTLAAVGLGATALAAVTGGSGYTIKIGAAVLKAARRMGRPGKGLGKILAGAATTSIRWNRIDEFVKTRKLSAITDVRHLEEIVDIAGKLGTVSKHANMQDTIFLLKHINNGKDAADLARLSKVAGKKTRGTVEVLGLARASVAIRRLSSLFILAAGLAVVLAGQLAALAAPVVLHMLRRIVRPSRQGKRKRRAANRVRR